MTLKVHIKTEEDSVLGQRLRLRPLLRPKMLRLNNRRRIGQRLEAEVKTRRAKIGAEAQCVFGSDGLSAVIDASAETGAFVAPRLFRCENPDEIHQTSSLKIHPQISNLCQLHPA